MTSAHRSVGILVLSAATVLGSLALTRARGSASLQRATPVSKVAPAPNLSATLESTHVLRGLSDTHLIVRIRAPEDQASTQRPAVAVGVVLDRSGSMHGEKLSQAKRAAIELVSALTERDRFSFTIYGTEVETLVGLTRATADAKRQAIDVINAVTDDGGTNLSGGMLAGRAELERALSEGGVHRVVLISDGRANEGVVYRDQLAELARQTAERGISITTVGVGLDFEEQTMTAIAVAGRGNYYYAEKARDMSSMFTTELGRVARTTATDVVLTVNPASGVEIVEAYGYQLRANTVEVADLHAGEERVVVFKIKVRSEVVGTADVAAVSLSMTDPRTGEATAQNVSVSAEITDDHQAVARGQIADAVRVVERAQTARTLETATELYERGDSAGARRLLEARQAEAKRRAASIGDRELASEIDGVADEAKKNFAPPSPASSAGKAGRKRNRKAAYDLLY